MNHRTINSLVFILLAFLSACHNNKTESKNNSNTSQVEDTKSKDDNTVIQIEKGFPTPIAEQFIQFRNLVLADNKQAIAALIPYPLKRPNELLKNEEDFVSYYENIFDVSLKNKIKELKIGQEDFIIKSDHYGILGGLMWFSRHTGEITSLRYQSEMENKMANL